MVHPGLQKITYISIINQNFTADLEIKGIIFKLQELFGNLHAISMENQVSLMKNASETYQNYISVCFERRQRLLRPAPVG